MRRHAAQTNELTPNSNWYIVAIAIMLLGPVWAAWSLQHILSDTSFTHTIAYNTSMASIHIDQPGTYTLWELANSDGNYEGSLSYSYKYKSEGSFSTNGTSTRKVTIEKTETIGSADINFHIFAGDKELALTPRTRPWVQVAPETGVVKLFFAVADVTFPKPGKYIVKASASNDRQYLFTQPTAIQLYYEVWFQLVLLVSSVLFGPILFLMTYFARRSNYRIRQTKIYDITQENDALSSFAISRFLIHFSALLGLSFPFGNLILPQIVMKLAKMKAVVPVRDIVERNFILYCNAVAVINFQLSFIVYMLVNLLLVFLLSPVFITGFIILTGLNIFLTLLGATFSSVYGLFLYPFSIQFVKVSRMNPPPR